MSVGPLELNGIFCDRLVSSLLFKYCHLREMCLLDPRELKRVFCDRLLFKYYHVRAVVILAAVHFTHYHPWCPISSEVATTIFCNPFTNMTFLYPSVLSSISH